MAIMASRNVLSRPEVGNVWHDILALRGFLAIMAFRSVLSRLEVGIVWHDILALCDHLIWGLLRWVHAPSVILHVIQSTNLHVLVTRP